MKYILIFCLLFSCSFCAFAQSEALIQAASKYDLKHNDPDVLEEEESTKTLVLKYDSAAATQKPAVKKELEKSELAREEELIEKQKQRIKRQEEQVKLLKQKLDQREKNKNKTVKERVDYLISAESIEKIKNESDTKKVIDKVKTKSKKKKK